LVWMAAPSRKKREQILQGKKRKGKEARLDLSPGKALEPRKEKMEILILAHRKRKGERSWPHGRRESNRELFEATYKERGKKGTKNLVNDE